MPTFLFPSVWSAVSDVLRNGDTDYIAEDAAGIVAIVEAEFLQDEPPTEGESGQPGGGSVLQLLSALVVVAEPEPECFAEGDLAARYSGEKSYR